MPSEPQRDPTARAKMLLALPDSALRRRIGQLADAAGLDVQVHDTEGDLASAVRDAAVDLVLLHRDDVGGSEFDTLTGLSADLAGVAVVGADVPAERARLFAAGASQVWTGRESVPELEAALEALAEAGLGGGMVRAPEVRGSDAQPRLADFQTQDVRMNEFVDLVQRVVGVDTTLLISGPTGVGKERLARAIHAEGPRAAGPFVAVNCGAIPESLLESELFGHEKGAFTGADQSRVGHFEMASGGVIFLDEIGEMPGHLQVKLLTVLQRHKIVRVGGQRTIPIDVRVIAATNRDLVLEVEQGRFREDLLYRLNIFPLEIPALAERSQDIPDLAGRFIAHFRESMPHSPVESISEEAVQALMSYGWPGNVRELINVIERAMVLATAPEITVQDLPPAVADPSSAGAGARGRPRMAQALPTDWQELSLKAIRERAVAGAESVYLEALLRQTRGHIGETARRAGISSRALYDRMKRYRLQKERFRNGAAPE